MITCHTTARRLLANERGDIAIITALALIPAILLGAGAIDFATAMKAKDKLQTAADAAALAGSSLEATASSAEREDAALAMFTANTQSDAVIAVTPQIVVNGTRVNVSGSTEVPTSFLRLISINTIAIAVTSIANSTFAPSAASGAAVCLLALDPDSVDGIHIQGNNTLSYANCWAHTNSSAATAINAVGSVATATGAGHCAVGGTSVPHNNFTPAPMSGCAVVQDPYATGSAYPSSGTYSPTFTPPAIPTDCKMTDLELKKGTYTLDPGRYCGGIDVKAQATVTLNPGIYIIDNGLLNVQSGATFTGSNVLFYFNGANARMQVIGGGTVSLKGRSTGSSLEGFLFIAHPDAWRDNTSRIQGGGTMELEGMLYMPTQRIEVGGNSTVNGVSNFFGMVAKDFHFIGNGAFNLKVHNASATMPDIMPRMPATQHIGNVALK